MNCLQQCRAKNILGKKKGTPINYPKHRLASEEDNDVHLLGLEGYCLLRTPANVEFSEFIPENNWTN